MRDIADHVAAQLFLLGQAACHRVEGVRQVADLVGRFHRHAHRQIALFHALGRDREALDRPQDADGQAERDEDGGQAGNERAQEHGAVDG